MQRITASYKPFRYQKAGILLPAYGGVKMVRESGLQIQEDIYVQQNCRRVEDLPGPMKFYFLLKFYPAATFHGKTKFWKGLPAQQYARNILAVLLLQNRKD